MKLTKGKISKLYNKKRQSVRKIKKRNTSNKRNTFRRKQKLNLARKTLKRFDYKKLRGGNTEIRDDEVSFPKEKLQDNNQNIREFETQPVPLVNEYLETSDPEKDVINDSTTTNEIENIQETIKSGNKDEVEPPAETVVSEPSGNKDEVENSAEIVVSEPSGNKDELETPSEIVVSEPSGNKDEAKDSKEELTKAIDTVVDFITDKVTQNISSNNIDIPQNGFTSINQMAETMANKGGKSRKNGKFRIKTKKNKINKLQT